jgi:hypothetical protein
MEKGMLHLHSFLRWAILILLLIAIVKSVTNKNKAFSSGHRKAGLFLMISADVMLLIGLYQWITGPWGLKLIQNLGMSAVMKSESSPAIRFFAVEHFIGMLIAIILIHIGYGFSKKTLPDAVKHKRTILFYGLALLIILVSIPWPFREVGAGRAWFPGM